MTDERIPLVVVLSVTILNTVYGVPTWNAPKGAPPTFVRPQMLPASFTRSTLSNDLLDIMKQSRSGLPPAPGVPRPAPADPSPDSATSSAAPASSVPSSVFEKLLTSYDQASSSSLEESENGPAARPNSPSTDPDGPQADSQLDRPPTGCDGSDPNLTPVVASFAPADTPLSERTAAGPDATTTSPPATGPAAQTPSAAAPFPGSTLVPIQPLDMPPKIKQELVKLLSDSVQTSPPQGPTENPPPNSHALHPSLTPSTAETTPFLSPGPLDPPSDSAVSCPDPVSQSIPAAAATPSQTARQLLNLLLSSPSALQQFKSLLSRSTLATSPSWSPSQSPSTPQPCLNLAFIKYLSTLPRCLNRQ